MDGSTGWDDLIGSGNLANFPDLVDGGIVAAWLIRGDLLDPVRWTQSVHVVGSIHLDDAIYVVDSADSV